MNDEKKIAQAILDAQKYREESSGIGYYKRDMEDCFQIACKNQGLSPNLWVLLDLAAVHWYDDVQLWAEDVLADKNIYKNTKMKDEIKPASCYDSLSKEKCYPVSSDNITICNNNKEGWCKLWNKKCNNIIEG